VLWQNEGFGCTKNKIGCTEHRWLFAEGKHKAGCVFWVHFEVQAHKDHIH